MIYVIISAGIFLLDLIIKNRVEKDLEYNKPKTKWNNRFIIRKVYNRGGAMNTLDSRQEFVAGFSAALTFTLVLAQIWLIGKKGFHILKLAFSFLIGGGLSNVYDRVVRKYVVDYVSFNTKIHKLRNIVFNISDFFIFIGTLMATVYTMLVEGRSENASKK